jgi:hypothetical protein
MKETNEGKRETKKERNVVVKKEMKKEGNEEGRKETNERKKETNVTERSKQVRKEIIINVKHITE